MPLPISEGQSGKLITTILRPGRRPSGAEIVTILKRLVPYLRQHWPHVRIMLRGDSHFSAPEVHDVCDTHRVYCVLGQSGNSRLEALMGHAVAQAQALYQASHEPVRLFTQFRYQADIWLTVAELVKQAAEANAHLVCFPEWALGGPSWHDDYRADREFAIEIPGPVTERIADLARVHGLSIAIGLF